MIYPQTALAVAITETGGFQSRKLMKTHNWFGFIANGHGFQSGQKGRFGVYKTAELALADYQRFEQETCLKYHIQSERQYRAWLTGHYAPGDASYTSKLASNLHLVYHIWN